MLGSLMIGIEGTQLLGEERERLQHPAVGGVILFARNYAHPSQLRELTGAIRALRSPPLLIAVDQEGGRVQRFREGFTLLPAMGQLGRAWQTAPALALEAAEQAAWLMATELRECDIDFSFAPVLDLDRGVSQVIGDRAFGASPDCVAALALAWQRGAKAAGMISVGKHFPGHGGVAPDSHHNRAVDHRALPDLLHSDLLPFRRLIDNGLAAVMTAHVEFPLVDEKPVGYSDKWIQYLRSSLNFQGAIFSDDLEMAAAAVVGDLAARAKAAIAAGCDMAILGNAGRAIDTVLDGIPLTDSRSALRLARLHGRGANEADPNAVEQRMASARALLAEL